MKRVGYDADTQVYTYRDQDGSLWEGPAGQRYGVLKQRKTQRVYLMLFHANLSSWIF
jgi:hypothetical protein